MDLAELYDAHIVFACESQDPAPREGYRSYTINHEGNTLHMWVYKNARGPFHVDTFKEKDPTPYSFACILDSMGNNWTSFGQGRTLTTKAIADEFCRIMIRAINLKETENVAG